MPSKKHPYACKNYKCGKEDEHFFYRGFLLVGCFFSRTVVVLMVAIELVHESFFVDLGLCMDIPVHLVVMLDRKELRTMAMSK